MFADSARKPKLQCDIDGVRHLIYCNQIFGKIAYANDATGEWAETFISGLLQEDYCFNFDFTLDAHGAVHVVYGDSYAGHYVTNATGQWVDEIIQNIDQNRFDLVVEKDGTTHLTCSDCPAGSPLCYFSYYHRNKSGWSRQILYPYIPNSFMIYSDVKSSTFAVRDGRADIVYLQGIYQDYMIYDCDSWTSEVIGDSFGQSRLDYYAGDAKFVAAADGTDYLGFVDDNCSDDHGWGGGAGPLQLAVRTADDWEVTTLDSHASDSPDMIMHPDGSLHLAYVWTITQDSCPLYYATNASGVWQSTLLAE